MNFVSFTDALAFTDWAGLRPITELEYEKAASIYQSLFEKRGERGF